MSGCLIEPKVSDPHAEGFAIRGQKRMYRGRQIAEGDTASDVAAGHEGAQELCARGS